MIGPLLRENIDDIWQRIRESGDSFDDFLTMYELIITDRLNSTNRSSRELEEADERIALIAFCEISWPGKPPSYKEEAMRLRKSFQGIANQDSLKDAFKSVLSQNLLLATDPAQINFSNIREVFGDPSPAIQHAVPVQIHQSEDRFTVATLMPGLEPQDISVSVSGDKVTIRGEYSRFRQNKPEALVSERTIGPYHREVDLPQPIISTIANATYSNGLLVLSIPKRKPGQIDVMHGQHVQIDVIGTTIEGRHLSHAAPSEHGESSMER